MEIGTKSVSEKKITEQTIDLMHKLVFMGKTDAQFIDLASWMVKGCAPKDYYCELNKIFNFTKDMIRYARDPYAVELVQEPFMTLERGAGDCDDQAVLIAALAGALGAPYRFVTLKADASRPDDWSHVYVQVYVQGKGWIAADPTVSRFRLGDEAEHYFDRKFWDMPESLYK